MPNSGEKRPLEPGVKFMYEIIGRYSRQRKAYWSAMWGD